MGSKKEEEEEEGEKKKSESEKIKSETDRKQPSGTGLTSSLTPDCHRKTISPQIKNICSLFSVPQQRSMLGFFFPLSLTSDLDRTLCFDKWHAFAVISSLLSVLNYYVIFVLCWVITFRSGFTVGGREASQLLDGGGGERKKNTRMLCSVSYIYIYFSPALLRRIIWDMRKIRGEAFKRSSRATFKAQKLTSQIFLSKALHLPRVNLLSWSAQCLLKRLGRVCWSQI